jgi:hypothetical protein
MVAENQALAHTNYTELSAFKILAYYVYRHFLQ